LSAVQLLIELLPARVGSLLSLNALREDLSVAHKTITQWMEILERFYYHFRLYPYAASKIRSLRKEPKLYLWDWSEVPDKAVRLENIGASHLLKLCHFLYDAHGYKADLHFLRDVDGREVDFLVSMGAGELFSSYVIRNFLPITPFIRGRLQLLRNTLTQFACDCYEGRTSKYIAKEG
jgi:predicted AAA+ superfamily ATPase